jgi:hypothetical protein
VPQTSGFQTDSLFQFTISPDDRWVVFFKQLTPAEIGTRHWALGNLRVLELATGELHEFTLAEATAPNRLRSGDASWARDSSHCLLPPPANIRSDPERGLILRFQEPDEIEIGSTRVIHGPKPQVEVLGIEYETLKEYTCSDCSPYSNDMDLIAKHVDQRYLELSKLPVNRNEYGAQIVSHDGTRIYFQKGRETAEVTLHEFDIASGKERQLTAHAGDCAAIQRMRASPDGRKLAYQVVTGCGFLDVPKLFVIDVHTGEREEVARVAGGTMHWTSTSDRLFFYRDEHLHVAEFVKPKEPPASKPAATAPATP